MKKNKMVNSTKVNNPEMKKRGRPKKIVVESSKDDKATKVSKIKAAEKKPDPVKLAKLQNKELMKQAKKLFGDSRKNVSAVKKIVKSYSKLMTTALKTDAKTAERISKLFGYINFSFDHDASSVNLNLAGKVRMPKAKVSKTDAAKTSAKAIETKPKRKYARKVEEVKPEVVVPEVVNPPEDKTEPSDSELEQIEKENSEEDGPTDDELEEIEKELENDPLGDITPDNGGNEEDEEHDDGEGYEDDGDEEHEPEEDDLFGSSALRDRSESDNEMFEAMRENGDID